MPTSRQQLVHDIVSAMHDEEASIFIGAGMSRPAGFVDWKGLLRECASELNLDIDRERDLVAVAQYYLNRRGRDRARLNKILKDEFDKPSTLTENHEIIARLPIQTFWTTNFDKLIELAMAKAGRRLDVKSRDQQIAISSSGRDVILYKMHGDITNPDEIIICKDDYERYAREHELFQNQLASELVNKTFLFLGFSFNDPHLEYMLGHLRSLLEDNKREHYAIMRKARIDWRKSKINASDAQKQFEYEKNRQDLQIEDLQRYSIQTHLIDEFSEVTDILESIEQHYYLTNIFVSGSAHELEDFSLDRMRDLCMQLGERLMERNHRLVTGMGLNVGDSVVKGALVKLYELGQMEIEKHLTLRPFPRNLPPGIKLEEFNTKNREDMISKCGIAIFIAGTSRSHYESEGVLEEYAIAKRLRKIPIPIGATGFAAKRIWKEIEPQRESIYRGVVSAELFNILNDNSASNDQIVNALLEILDKVSEI